MGDWAVWNSSRGVCGMSCLWDETRKQGNLKELEPQRPVGLHSEAGALPSEEPGVADGVQHARKSSLWAFGAVSAGQTWLHSRTLTVSSAETDKTA